MLSEPINLGQFFNGLTSLGKLEQNKWVNLDNCDIHTESGLVMPQKAMENETTIANENCIEAIDPNGNVYGISLESGKIWKRTTAASWTLIHTNANGAHRGGRYFNGFLWYWTATKLGTFDLNAAWNDSFATGIDFRGSIEANNTMLIANGRYVARVDAANAFAAQEFVAPAQYKITVLQNVGDDVLIGSIVSPDVAYCKVFLWDTVSPSWTYEDEIYEIGVNCFIPLDDVILAQCGTEGRFYYWTGAKMKRFGKILGITTGLGEQKSAVYNGRALYANANKIYSIHKESDGFSYAFCGEYTCSGNISSIFVQGQNLLASVGSAGFDKRGNNYAIATIESPEIQAKIDIVKVKYDIYPEGVSIETSVNGAEYVNQTSKTIDTIEKEVSFNGGVVDGSTMQTKIILTPSGSNIPKIKTVSLQ